MDPSPTSTGAAETPRRSASPLTWILFGVLLALTAVAVGLHLRRNRPPDPLRDDIESASGALADVLEKTPEAQRTPLLLKHVQDPSPGLRAAAVDALSHAPTPEALDAIEKALADSSSLVRVRALEVLWPVAPERGLRLLLAGVHDEDTWVRETAITQLSLCIQKPGIDGKDAIPTLISALDDSENVLPTTAMNILRKLTGQPWRIRLETSPAARQAAVRHWKDWWQANQGRYAIPPEFANVAPIHPTRADPAPDFALRDIEGHPISLEGQRGKVTLLNFWGSWCEPCQAEVPALAQLDRTYRARGLDIIGVAVAEQQGADGLRRWCKAHGAEYRQTLATDAIRDAFGHIEEVPVSVLLDKQGRIRYRWDGDRDYRTFRAAVERLVQE